MKYTYNLESFFNEKWVKLFTQSRDYCLGYINHAKYCYPRNDMRVIRSDGKVIEELKEYEDVSIGMVAGWPTAQQYENAAKRALEQAERIRQRENDNRP